MLKMLVRCGCDRLCILVEIPLKFHYLMSYIVLIFCAFNLVIENILSCDKLIEVVVICCGYFRVKKLFTYNE